MGTSAAASSGARSWILPAVAAIVISGGWALVAGSAVDGSGPSLLAVIVIALFLAVVIAWRAHAWRGRRVAGASGGGVIARAAWEGALVMLPWALIGASAFMVRAAITLAATLVDA